MNKGYYISLQGKIDDSAASISKLNNQIKQLENKISSLEIKIKTPSSTSKGFGDLNTQLDKLKINMKDFEGNVLSANSTFNTTTTRYTNNAGKILTVTEKMVQFVQARPGDWFCASCSSLNFASRIRCFRCNLPRPGTVTDGPNGEMYLPAQQARQTIKPGDWYCESCHYLNFASRRECKQCGTPMRADQVREETPRRGGSNSRRPMLQGDWICPSCSYHNFARRINCFQCSQPRPDN